MILPVAVKIAIRELRTGTRDFRVLMACLAIGVASIATIGSIQTSIEQGLSEAGKRILGGDAQIEFTYRRADQDELAWMNQVSHRLSEIIDFRSMAVASGESGSIRVLTQLKAVDDAYPLVGSVHLEPDRSLSDALGQQNGIPGAIMKPELANRLGLVIGDSFKLGLNEFKLTAILISEPDSAGAGFGLGPRTIVKLIDLEGSQLLGPGTLYESKYRLLLPPGSDIAQLKSNAENLYIEKGLSWSDRRNGAPGVSAFINRVGAFLIIVGLAGLVIGGVGVSLAVSTYLEGKTISIATLKSLGATQKTIFSSYFIQVGLMTCVGIAAGLVLGTVIPLLFGISYNNQLPVPAQSGIYVQPLIEAAVYGLLVSLIFALWALARTSRVKPAALFRDAIDRAAYLPPPVYLISICILTILFIGIAVYLSGTTRLTLYIALGTFGTLAVLLIASILTKYLSSLLTRSHFVRGKTILRLALGSIGGPGHGTAPVILSLGLGLSVLSAVGQISTNLINSISDDLPDIAPSYFIIDIQNAQLNEYLETIDTIVGINRIDKSPMLRGIITKINGKPAREVAGNHWVLRGDRGITYSQFPDTNTHITEGEWWPPNYNGIPQISFSEEAAKEMNLVLGDMLTINILGRDIDAIITSFRVVDFSTVGMGFIIAMNPSALQGAPHTYISTVYGNAEADDKLVEQVGSRFPNVTIISVKEGISNFVQLLSTLVAAITYSAGATLVVGFIVLVGTAAREASSRIFDAAVLKTLGAQRKTILLSMALRSAILGIVAGFIAIAAGSIGGYAVMVIVMESSYQFLPIPAIALVVGGAVTSLIAGLAFSARPLSVRPSRILQARE